MIDLTVDIDNEQAKKELEELFNLAAQLASKTENDRSKLDEDYWEGRKKIAAEALSTIKAEQIKSIEAGDFAGVPPEAIESYQKYSQALKEAEVALEALAMKETSLEDITKTVKNLSGLFEDKSKKSIDELRRVAEEAQKLLEYATAGEFSSDNPFGITQENFDLLAKSPEKQEELKNAIDETNQAASNSNTAFSKISQGFKDMFDSSKTLGEQKEAMKMVSEGFSEASKAVGVLSSAFTSLGDAFGNDVLSGIGDGIGVLTDTLSGMSSGMAAGAAFGPIGAAAGGAISGIVSLTTSIAKLHDKVKEKKIKQYQREIDDLKRSSKNLEDSISKAYSSDKAALIEDENENLKKQQDLIQQQIDAENSKKKTDKDKIKQWQNEIEDINKQIEANKEKQIDAIFGEDVKKAIDNFANAYMNAWSQGDDKTKTSSELVKKMIQDMVTEMIKAKMASDDFMETLRAKMMDAAADGEVSALEEQQLQDFVQEEMDAIEEELGWADRFIKNKEKEEEKPQQKSSAKGFETMSQDVANELNGRFALMTDTMLQSREIQNSLLLANNSIVSCFLGVNNTLSRSGDIQQQMLDAGIQTAEAAFNIRDVALTANIHLLNISNNTGASATALQGIDTRLKRIEENTTYLK